jgi:hypothetical protein
MYSGLERIWKERLVMYETYSTFPCTYLKGQKRIVAVASDTKTGHILMQETRYRCVNLLDMFHVVLCLNCACFSKLFLLTKSHLTS